MGLAFVRSWLLASNKRSLVYVWPPLILVRLLVTSAAESTILFEFGWLLLVICSVKAAQGLSWRSALQHMPHPDARMRVPVITRDVRVRDQRLPKDSRKATIPSSVAPSKMICPCDSTTTRSQRSSTCAAE